MLKPQLAELIETETELLLVRRWLRLLQKHYRLYNIDYSHQCLSGMGVKQCVENSSIVQVFPGVDNFFGCLQCGQYHFCRRLSHSCYVTSDHIQQQLYCLFSGHLLSECENYETEPFNIQHDNTVTSLETNDAYNTTKTFKLFKEKPKLYTNIKTNGFRKRAASKEVKEEKEWKREEKKPRKDSPPSPPNKNNKNNTQMMMLGGEEEEDLPETETGGTFRKSNKVRNYEEEEGIMEEMYDECCDGNEIDWCHFITKRKNSDYNYLYWSNYYSFLFEKRAPPPKSPNNPFVQCSEGDGNRVKKKPTPQRPFNDKIGKNGEVIEKECHIILERLLLFSEATTTTTTITKRVKKEDLFLLLCDYFIPLVKNFYLLIHNSPVVRSVALDKRLTKAGKKPLVMTPKQVSEAVILHLLTESYQVEDIAKNKIQLWVRNPWIIHLQETGLLSRYYTTYLNKNGNTMERATHTKNDIKECLSFYFQHPFWLQHFLQTIH